MTADRYAARRDQLRQLLRKSDDVTLLVTNATNVTYLTGFSGDSSYLFVGRGMLLLVSDSRFTLQIKQECPELDVYIRKRTEPISESVAKIVKRAKLRKLGIESHSMTVQQAEYLTKSVKQLELVSLAGTVEELRLIKDADEIGEIREAIRQAEAGFAITKAGLRLDMTELSVAHELEHAMRRFGAYRASFDPIVAVGPRAALPHARPDTVRVRESDHLLIDWGASTRSGYKSDLTRVLVTGKIRPKLEKIYRVVLNAQRRGIRAIRPGAKCNEVDAAARRVIEHAGFGRYFGHSLGHGIGLDIHEGPRLSAESNTQLKPGMVVTVEPGIYLPEWGGVRLEDDVLVTREGCEVLTAVPKAFEENHIE